MKNLSEKLKNELIEKFGNNENVTFEETERVIYSHDMGSLPQIVDKMINTIPQAVVRVRNIDDVKFLVDFSRENRIPLTPRGNATSGYGDSMPFGNGISVDFMQMRKVLSLSEDELTVEVEGGIVFWNLERYLNKKGYSQRVYPSSAPGATVAGWISEGGSGIGSYEYGSFKENIIEIEAILPNSEIKIFKNDEIDLIYASQGTIGLITRVKIKIRKYENISTLLINFKNIEDLVLYLNELSKKELNIFNANCFLGEGLSRRIEAVKNSKGVKFSTFTDKEIINNLDLDNLFIDHKGIYLLLAINGEKLDPQIIKLVVSNNGVIDDSQLANYLWSDRFYPMREKRLGPSLIPSEAIISMDALPKVWTEITEQVEDISLEGTLTSKNEVVLLGFVLHDERTFAFSFDYVKSLLVMDIIEKYGGRLYQVGIFFTDKADSIKGKEKMDKLRSFKNKYDPDNLLNPGKLFPSKYVPKLLNVAMKAGKGSKSFAELVSGFMSKSPKISKKIASDIVFEAFACAQCGYCKVVCSEYAGKGWESSAPRGKFYFIREFSRGNKKFSKYLSDNFLLCTTCKRCNHVCQVNIPIQEKWDDMRGFLVQDKKFPTFPPFEMMGGSYELARNIWTGRINERDKWVPKEINIDFNNTLNYWAGCTASYVEKDISVNSVRILKEGEVKFNYLGNDESCCGIPFLMAGKWDLFEDVVRYNVMKFKEKDITQIITSCPGCWVSLNHYYRVWAKKLGLEYPVTIYHITEVASKLIENKRLNLKEINETVTYHDSCHIGRHGGIYEQPRKVLSSIPGTKLVEMEHNRDDGLCCGSVLTRIGEPIISDKIAKLRLDEAEVTGASKIITNCPCCEFQLRVAAKSLGKNVNIQDISTYVCESLGYTDLPDSVADVNLMWGVFAKAIDIMTDDGIINMMDGMFPQMVDAMPGAFKGMTKMVIAMPKSMRKPFASMFRSMLPSLMPMLLPSMLPKLSPTIGDIMMKEIPDMPDQMKEMLPAMLPSVLKKVMKGALSSIAAKLGENFYTFLMNQ
jgi:Fe-S oxidoreductase/FAD/FMN-containing dehydrogenase